MRLINTSTLQLEEFADLSLPPYAILSHRWTTDEITFQELSTSSRELSRKKGYAKLQGFCNAAKLQNYRHGWIDTCCINKESSTELATAISSMFSWYSDADLCIVYLEDVGPGRKEFDESEWFERGWTLQELIAPKRMQFYDYRWQFISKKKDCLDELHEITKIPKEVLGHTSSPSEFSVAQRMSWASSRITERIEDRAYSLMGLFSVNMGLIYGEKEQAFVRLQQHIMQHSADQSIFAWDMDPTSHPSGVSGLLAPSPRSFAGCGDIVPTQVSAAYGLTNIGVSISWSTTPYTMETYLAYLECTSKDDERGRYAVLISRLAGKDQYARVMGIKHSSLMFLHPQSTTVRQVYVRQLPEPPTSLANRSYGFWLRTVKPPRFQKCTINILSKAKPLDGDRLMIPPARTPYAGIISVVPIWTETGDFYRRESLWWLLFGFDSEFNPLIYMANGRESWHVPNKRIFGDALTQGFRSEAHAQVFRRHEWLTENHRGHNRCSNCRLLKVDKHTGGTFEFPKLNLKIDLQVLPDRMPQNDRILELEGAQTIWTVDITNLGQGPFERSKWTNDWCCISREDQIDDWDSVFDSYE